MQTLEQVVDNQHFPGKENPVAGYLFPTKKEEIEVYENPAIRNYGTQKVLYTGKPSEPLRIYDMPSGTQLHLHNDCAFGNIQGNGFKKNLNAYESAMADYYANNLGFNKTDTLCNPKKF